MAMSAQLCDTLIPVQSVKELPAILEETQLLSYIVARGRWGRKRIVTQATDQNIPYYIPGRKNVLPDQEWTSKI
jgi:hypothetical protein